MSECVNNNLDNPSFEEIFKLHHLRVYILCLRMTGRAAEAEDLTQKIFVYVFRNLERFQGEAAFSTLLQRLTVNQVLMHFRRSLLRKEKSNKGDELPTLPEIARAFGRLGGTPRSRLHRARMKLRQLLTRRFTPGKIDGAIGPDPVN